MVFLVISLSACNRFQKKEEPKDKNKAKAAIVVPVEAVSPSRGDISAYFETTTRVEAERRVDVTTEGIGKCERINVEEGDRVHQGQILAELEKEEALAALAQAEVQVKQNLTSYELSKNQYQQGLVPKVELDNAYYAYEQARQNVKIQRIQVENLTIRSPINGIVTARNVQHGMLVTSGMPAFTIVDPSSYILSINPPENQLSRLSVGQQATVTLDAFDGEEFKVQVRRINPSVDPLTGTIKVVLDFEESVRGRLRDSAFARVKLVMETHKDVVLIPKDAILEENARRYVFLVKEDEVAELTPAARPADGDQSPEDENAGPALLTSQALASVKDDVVDDSETEPIGAPLRAERVEVIIGLEDSRFVEIIGGVRDTDLLVINGQHTLKSGASVRITNISEDIFGKSAMAAEDALIAAKERRKGEDKKDRRRRGFGGHH